MPEFLLPDADGALVHSTELLAHGPLVVTFMPVPATFLVDRDGIVARAWVNADFTRRAEPAEVVAALRALHPP